MIGVAGHKRHIGFIATIYKIWMMRHVNVPDEIARDLLKQLQGARGETKRGKQPKPKYIPIVAIVGGKSTRTTLVPAGSGHYRMQINTAQRKAASANAGDAVSVECSSARFSANRPSLLP